MGTARTIAATTFSTLLLGKDNFEQFFSLQNFTILFCCNHVRSIVYNAASMAVVYNKGAGKQQFLKGAHTDEVVSICCHPAGQIFATGEAGRQPSIIIW